MTTAPPGGSDVKYGIPEWGSIHGVPPIISCLEKKETFDEDISLEEALSTL